MLLITGLRLRLLTTSLWHQPRMSVTKPTMIPTTIPLYVQVSKWSRRSWMHNALVVHQSISISRSLATTPTTQTKGTTLRCPSCGPVTINVPDYPRTIPVSRWVSKKMLWGLVCQMQVSRAGTSNYITQYLWDVITCPCPWYLHLAQHSWYTLKRVDSPHKGPAMGGVETFFAVLLHKVLNKQPNCR